MSHYDSRYPPLHEWAPGQPPNPGRHFPPLPPRPTDLIHDRPSLPDEPPPVPSTPRPNLTATPTLKYPDISEVFTLPQLVEKHQNLFPLKVVVVKGHYGDRGEDSAIATNELYNIHFIKRSKVFTVKDESGYKYIVPLNTACKFGIYYEKETCCFDTIDDVMKASPLPKVIAAQTAYYGGSPKSGVQRLEILVVKGVNKGRLRKPTLSVFSVTKKEEKQLSKEVLGRFTTDPTYTYMYLTDLIKYVPFKFPLDVHLYPEFDGDVPTSNYMVSERMTIVNEFTETCVVTSPLLDEEDESGDNDELSEHVVDIPLTLPIEVSVLPPKDDDLDDYEQLYETTRTLISGYDPIKSKTYRDTADDYSYTTQTRVFSAVRKGFENAGLNIEMPQAISATRLPLSTSANQDSINRFPERAMYEDMDAPHRLSTDSYEDFDPPSTSPIRSPRHQSNPESGFQQPIATPPARGYNVPTGHNSFRHSQNLESLSSPHQPTCNPPSLPPRRGTSSKPPPLSVKKSPPPVAPRRQSQLATSADGVFLRQSSQPSPPTPSMSTHLQQTLDSLQQRVGLLESSSQQGNSSELINEIGSMESMVQSLQTTCNSLSDSVDTLMREVEALKSQVTSLSSLKSGTTPSTATTSLQTLSCEQLLQLLEVMGPSLARYRETFSKEFIDGELLSQCTEDILENDLGMKNKLDRLKLMQVIKGTKSVESILQGSYVKFQFNGASKKT